MNHRGMTVIEVLVSVGLLAMLTGALSAFLWDVERQRALLGRLGEERLASNALIERLDLALRFTEASSAGGTGFVGSPTSMSVPYRVAELEALDADAGALAGVRTLELAWNEPSATLTLNGAALTTRAARVVLRYHDGTGWRDSHDARTAGGLPVAVELALWFGEPAEDDSTPTDTRDESLPALGEGFGLPTPSEFDDLLAIDAFEREWGEPDRRRVFTLTQLRSEDAAPSGTEALP